MRQVQRDGGERPGPTSAEIARIKELERENRELRQGEEDQKTIRGIVFPTNEILRKGKPLTAPLVQARWRARILLRPLSRFEDKPLSGSESSTARSANDCFH